MRIRLFALALAACGALVFTRAAAASEAPAPTAFTYQGRLAVNGAPVTGSYDFQFTLVDGFGITVAGPVTVTSVPVANGVFTATVEFGLFQFDLLRQLVVAVRPAGSGSYTTLSPPQKLTPTPFASYSKAGRASDLWIPLGASGSATAQPALVVTNTGASNSLTASAIQGVATDANAIGVWGTAAKTGVYGSNDVGFQQINPSTFASAGVYGRGVNGAVGVYGRSVDSDGVFGGSENAAGVDGTSSAGSGVQGTSASGFGVYGVSGASVGVKGQSNGGSSGVYGVSASGYGVSGKGVVGMYAEASGTTNKAYLATSYAAADFKGDVAVYGTLSKLAGSFKIDHPLDPANKYLSHSFVESPDMKNVYDGVATLDEKGEATVAMPDWFEALNGDFRYQLTPIGRFAPLYVAREIERGAFRIAGGAPGLRVSWQVTGIRRDAWANAHRIRVEEEKPPSERGTFLTPELFGAGAEKSVTSAREGGSR